MDITQLNDEIWLAEFSEYDSSYVRQVLYNKQTLELEIIFKNEHKILYKDIPRNVFINFVNSDSKGKFYNSFIKSQFKTKNSMARYELELTGSIDLRKVNKDLLLEATKPAKDGHVPMYLNIKILYSEKPDVYGQNGFIAQTTPKQLRDTQAGAKQPALGNIKNWNDYDSERKEMAGAGDEDGTGLNPDEGASDDLPF